MKATRRWRTCSRAPARRRRRSNEFTIQNLQFTKKDRAPLFEFRNARWITATDAAPDLRARYHPVRLHATAAALAMGRLLVFSMAVGLAIPVSSQDKPDFSGLWARENSADGFALMTLDSTDSR